MNSYQTIWENILKVQRKTRLLALLEGYRPGEAGGALSYSEGLVLHMVASYPGSNLKELAKIMNLERSWVSRLMSALGGKKCVKVLVSENDQRSRKLEITAHGLEVLKKLNAARKTVVEKALIDLNPDEQHQLELHLKELADGLKAPRYATIGDSHPVDAQYARISWEVGVIGEDYMHSGLGVTAYQVFFSLAGKGDKEFSNSELHQFLPFDMSTISRTVAAFVEHGWVQRKETSHDKRSALLQLTPKGLAFWRDNLKTASKVLAEGLNGAPEARLESFIALLEKATAQMPKRGRALVRKAFEVMPADSRELQESTARFVEEHRCGAPGKLKSFAILHNDQLRGVIKMAPERSGDNLREVFVIGSEIKPKELLRCLQSVLSEK
jgi:DNA-binding MarR family transcriptional regulator